MKSLLSRWREKVFVLLVQQKLQQIQDSREKMEARVKVKLAHFRITVKYGLAFDLLTVLIIFRVKERTICSVITLRRCLHSKLTTCAMSKLTTRYFIYEQMHCK